VDSPPINPAVALIAAKGGAPIFIGIWISSVVPLARLVRRIPRADWSAFCRPPQLGLLRDDLHTRPQLPLCAADQPAEGAPVHHLPLSPQHGRRCARLVARHQDLRASSIGLLLEQGRSADCALQFATPGHPLRRRPLPRQLPHPDRGPHSLLLVRRPSRSAVERMTPGMLTVSPDEPLCRTIYLVLICQTYLTVRSHLFLRSVEGRLFVWRRAITLFSSALVLGSATCGFVGQVELHSFPT
jgi:hypothetical protein